MSLRSFQIPTTARIAWMRVSRDPRYRSRATCRTKPRAERGACMNAARADLKHARSEAKAAHDAAKAAR